MRITSIVRPLLVAVTLTASFASSSIASPAAAADAIDKLRLQTMLIEGDVGMIAAVFRRHPGQTLPFIDSYLEGGLAMIEKGGDSAPSSALQSFRMGIKFAKIADDAFGGTTFSEYANAFASFSPSEQKSFREGQRLFRAGMKAAKDDPAAAIVSLKESLSLARSLGDLWGQAMAEQGIAEVGRTMGGEQLSMAYSASMSAAKLNQQLRLVDDWVESMRLKASIETARDQGLQAIGSLYQAWEQVSSRRDADPQLVQAVGTQLVAALDAAKQTEDAARLRKEIAERSSEPAKSTSGSVK